MRNSMGHHFFGPISHDRASEIAADPGVKGSKPHLSPSSQTKIRFQESFDPLGIFHGKFLDILWVLRKQRGGSKSSKTSKQDDSNSFNCTKPSTDTWNVHPMSAELQYPPSLDALRTMVEHLRGEQPFYGHPRGTQYGHRTYMDC